MKLTAGVITEKLQESKEFYTSLFNFGITFESDWFILLNTPDNSAYIGLLTPGHPSQNPIFQPAFEGKGMFITLEVEDVDEEYKKLMKKDVKVEIPLCTEPWGDRHFAIMDPNGIGIDIVTHQPVQQEN